MHSPEDSGDGWHLDLTPRCFVWKSPGQTTGNHVTPPSDHTIISGVFMSFSLPSLVTCTLASSRQVAAEECEIQGPHPSDTEAPQPTGLGLSGDEPEQAAPGGLVVMVPGRATPA